MRAFAYHKPDSVQEAAALLANSVETQPIAGGMSLLPAMKLRLTMPGALIDLSGIAVLKGISATTDTLTIGAMTRHVDVADLQTVAKSIPALAQLAGSIGDPAVRAQSAAHLPTTIRPPIIRPPCSRSAQPS